MKKYGSLILLALLLVATVYYLLAKSNSGNDASTEPFSDFAIKDTANIESFTISDTENNTITITRKKDGKTWMIGDSDYEAQPSSVDLIMETFYRVKIKQDVPEKAIENVLTQLSVRSKKVEIFMKGENSPSKTWYIGSATIDHMGTYMLLKKGNTKSSVPYITHKPDMYGTLDVRFFTDFQTWRSSQVFAYKPHTIKEINVKFNETPDQSYTVLATPSHDVSLLDGNNMPVQVFDSSQVKHYLTHYKKIHFESVNKDLTQIQVDSVMAQNPHYEISVTDVNDIKKEVRIWKMRLPEIRVKNENGDIEWNPERAWCSINGSEELVKVQFYSWDVLLKPLSFYKR